MRWNKDKNYKRWETKIVKSFAYLPTKLKDNSIIWLESYYKMVHQYNGYWWCDDMRHKALKEDDLIDVQAHWKRIYGA